MEEMGRFVEYARSTKTTKNPAATAAVAAVAAAGGGGVEIKEDVDIESTVAPTALKLASQLLFESLKLHHSGLLPLLISAKAHIISFKGGLLRCWRLYFINLIAWSSHRRYTTTTTFTSSSNPCTVSGLCRTAGSHLPGDWTVEEIVGGEWM